MRRNKSSWVLLSGFCILLLMTVFMSSGFATEKKESPQLYKLSYVQVKPGMGLEFEEFIKSIIPTFKNLGLTEMYISKTTNYGMSDKYTVLMPLDTPEAMDAEIAAQKSSVPVGIVAALSAIQRMVVSSHDLMLIPQPDFNIPLAEGYKVKLIVNFTVDVVPGRDDDFKKGLKKVVDALGKTKVKGVLIGKVGFGGNMDQYIMSVFYDSFKDMAANEPAIQKELAALDLDFLTGAIQSRKSEVYIEIPELCVEPAAK